MQYDDLKALLRTKGASLTKARKTVFSILLAHKPLTIAEITSLAAGQADRASVYRSLALFEDIGIVHRLNIGWKYKIELSDTFVRHHHHFYCSRCQQTYSLEANQMLETMIDSFAAKSGHHPRGHQLEIYGLCVNCSAPDG